MPQAIVRVGSHIRGVVRLRMILHGIYDGSQQPAHLSWGNWFRPVTSKMTYPMKYKVSPVRYWSPAEVWLTSQFKPDPV
jgi:hypothetical protein